MAEFPGVAALFVAGARTVVSGIADPAVARAWDLPSVLEDQQVSSLAGHLARGGVWVVADYLAAGTPAGPPDLDSAAEYFAHWAEAARPVDHRAIRERGASVAAVGRVQLLETLDQRLEGLERQLEKLPGDHLVVVAGGMVMRLHDYLETRIVEQAVHLDDLARSAGRDPWPLPEQHHALAVAVGVDVARRRNGPAAVLRAVYRQGAGQVPLLVL